MEIGKRARRVGRGPLVRRLVMVGAILAAAACSSSSSPVGPVAGGSQFTATVTGVVSTQLTGTARSFGTATGTPAWAVELLGENSSGGVSFTEEGMPRPSTGVYAIASALEHGGNAPNSAFTGVVLIASPASSFGSLSGTLTITASSPTSVSGEFTFTAADPDDESRTITVTGEFTASNQDV
ncbi:MAG: hypothetical protein OEO23_09475 [Gemmatimonadota bacterium]|nr:hypothetical protein [Gemmatimonadota bacterium]